jgi:preprotein translocase subunit SecD
MVAASCALIGLVTACSGHSSGPGQALPPTGASGPSSSAPATPSAQLTLAVSPLGGGASTPELVNEVYRILQERLAANHIGGATLTVAGNTLDLVVPAVSATSARAIVTQVGALRFRQVLSVASGAPQGAGATALAGGSVGAKPLPGSESSALTARFTKAFQAWDCAKSPNPTQGADRPTDYIIACDPGAGFKYILAPAALEGTDIASATADLDQNDNWVVDLSFTGSGSTKWFDLTKKTFEVTDSGDSGFQTGCAPPKGCNAIAITLDGVVESAPATQDDGIAGGRTQISGSFTRDAAAQLANALKYGALPARVTVSSVTRPAG